MDSKLRDQLKAHLVNYERQRKEKQIDKLVPYGTAGFRGEAKQIEHLFFNVGLISGLKCLLERANVGLMITASHNPVQDNGIKLVESNGEMLNSSWEPIVEQFCNTHQTETILDLIDHIIREHKINFEKHDRDFKVLIGMDTRPSSESLVTLVKQGLNSLSPFVDYIEYGLITTPVLHYLVAETNKNSTKHLNADTYYEQLVEGLFDIFQQTTTRNTSYSPNQLVVDCANGVGSKTMQKLLSHPNFNQVLPASLINTGDGILNRLCGADYIKTVQLPSSGANDTLKRYASLDGDADRLVYFFLDNEANNEGRGDELIRLKLLDGDKIMALFAIYLKDIISCSGLENDLTLGCIQTAYANGASTDYLANTLKIKVDCVDTGVKNLHKQAIKYDMGIYFEANGHGTIWISEKARNLIEDKGNEKVSDFRRLLKIINNYTGDAISDILVTESILRHYDWDVREWFKLYDDRPNSLMKVEVSDRSLIKTINAGRTCLAPEGLQSAIDAKVAEFGCGARSFVRPSGTENVVRVYAEANDQESCSKLAESICKLVEQYCNK